jgi:hypothetical protein
MPKIARTKNPSGKPRVSAQLSLFDRPDPVRAELRKIQVDRLTPLEALNVLDDLKKKAAREE